MVAPLHHLRREVVERPAQRLAPAVRRVHGPTEVRDLQLALDADEQVFGLDVAVDHVLLVAVQQSLGQRRNVRRRALLAEPLALLELLVQLTACGILEDQKYAVLRWSGGRIRTVSEAREETDGARGGCALSQSWHPGRGGSAGRVRVRSWGISALARGRTLS